MTFHIFTSALNFTSLLNIQYQVVSHEMTQHLSQNWCDQFLKKPRDATAATNTQHE